MIIELKNISKKFKDKVIFNNFNLAINEGELVAVVGNSGSGKSTLLNMIGCIESPDCGEIIIDGYKNPWKNEKEKLKIFRYKLGYLFQNYGLIDDYTVDKNLDIALEYVKDKEKDKMKKKVLKRVGLEEQQNSKVYTLSGGEQQRVALARLMLKDSKIILADEPTGSLDECNRNNVLNELIRLNKEGKTVVIVTHDMYVANMCDRIISI